MRNTINLIKSDVLSYGEDESLNLKDFIIDYIRVPGIQITTWLRLCQKLESKCGLGKMLYAVARWKYRRKQIKFGIQMGHHLHVGGDLISTIMAVL